MLIRQEKLEQGNETYASVHLLRGLGPALILLVATRMVGLDTFVFVRLRAFKALVQSHRAPDGQGCHRIPSKDS